MSKTRLIAVRVTPDILESLDEVASNQNISKSVLVRDLLENCHSLYRFLQSERERQKTDRIVLDGNLSQWVLEHMPHDMSEEQVRFIGRVMDHVADMMVTQGRGKTND
jgi:predicted transcriptional regulator